MNSRLRRLLGVVSWVALGILGAGCASGQQLPAVSSIVRASPTIMPTATSTPRPTPTPRVLPVGQIGDWRLIFSDDFNGVALNTQKWQTCYWWDKRGCTIITNNELEWYQPDNVSLENGALQLRAQQQQIDASNGNAYDYTSGMITSGRATSNTSRPAKFTFVYGYAEMRAKIPKGQGLWPAFWLLPADHTSRPEIDVMEIIGDEPHVVNLRFHYQATGDEGDVGGSWTGPDFSADWHTFAIDWRPEALIWYVDGAERWRYEDKARIPSVAMYLLINLAVGGDWPGPPNATTPFPSDFQIDYVRVWQPGSVTSKFTG